MYASVSLSPELLLLVCSLEGGGHNFTDCQMRTHLVLVKNLYLVRPQQPSRERVMRN